MHPASHHRPLWGALQSECGFQFTSKFEGMFADLNVSKDTMVQYNKVRAGQRWCFH